MTKQVPTRIANVLMNALKGGVVPRTGLEYITVGRTQEIAAILHDCGKFINMSDSAQNSYNIIMSTEIVGLSHVERQEVANIVRYNTKYLPGFDKIEDNLSIISYMKIAKLTAILRIANGMDRSHKQKIQDITLSVKEKQLIIKAGTSEDITLEKGLFESKAKFFQNIYGILPVLKQEQKL